MNSLPRLSLNEATIKGTPLATTIELCRVNGIGHVGVWRESVAELRSPQVAALLTRAGIDVSSLCRGGFFTASDPQQRATAIASNRAAIVEAAAIGSPTLVLVAGGLPPGERDLPAARGRVVDAIAELVDEAMDQGVRLAIEPLHPMFCADRSVVSTLAQALDIAELFPAMAVGVMVDTYHVWWDPDLPAQIARAGDRIAGFQVCDWILPLPEDMLLGRGHLGDGFIDFADIARLVDRAGYTGPIEVEIFNRSVWSARAAETVATVVERYRTAFG